MDVNLQVKRELEKCSCRVHSVHPKVEVTSKGLSISCCCDEFRQELLGKMEDLYAKAIEDYVMEPFKRHNLIR